MVIYSLFLVTALRTSFRFELLQFFLSQYGYLCYLHFVYNFSILENKNVKISSGPALEPETSLIFNYCKNSIIFTITVRSRGLVGNLNFYVSLHTILKVLFIETKKGKLE